MRRRGEGFNDFRAGEGESRERRERAADLLGPGLLDKGGDQQEGPGGTLEVKDALLLISDKINIMTLGG